MSASWTRSQAEPHGLPAGPRQPHAAEHGRRLDRPRRRTTSPRPRTLRRDRARRQQPRLPPSMRTWWFRPLPGPVAVRNDTRDRRRAPDRLRSAPIRATSSAAGAVIRRRWRGPRRRDVDRADAVPAPANRQAGLDLDASRTRAPTNLRPPNLVRRHRHQVGRATAEATSSHCTACTASVLSRGAAHRPHEVGDVGERLDRPTSLLTEHHRHERHRRVEPAARS